MNDRDKAVALYHQHIEDVKASVAPDRLLIYSVDQDWGLLCKFLGVPAPETQFPNANDRKSFKIILNRKHKEP